LLFVLLQCWELTSCILASTVSLQPPLGPTVLILFGYLISKSLA
jgi:hypothetical protein